MRGTTCALTDPMGGVRAAPFVRADARSALMPNTATNISSLATNGAQRRALRCIFTRPLHGHHSPPPHAAARSPLAQFPGKLTTLLITVPSLVWALRCVKISTLCTHHVEGETQGLEGEVVLPYQLRVRTRVLRSVLVVTRL